MEDTTEGYQGTPLVSVVIPCRNGGGTLGAQLAALAAQDYAGPIEIIVADNGSTDDTAAIARAHPGVRVIDASGRTGPNHARNVGADAAVGAVILACDADDIATTGWVTAMVRALRDHDVVAGHLDYHALNPSPEATRASERFEGRSRLGFLPTAAGANFGIRTPVLRALGGWDASIGGGGDDSELCWRAQLAGYRFGFADDAVMQYRLRSDTTAVMKQAYRGATWTPLIFRRFRRAGMPVGPLLRKAVRFGGYLVVAAPGALFSRRIRREWLRRGALAAGFARGMFRRDAR